MAFADIHLRSDLRAEGKLLSKEFSFYGKFSKQVNTLPLKKYCDMPPKVAKEYLDTLLKTAEIIPLDAYHYGTLIGFAPCLDKNLDDAAYYLEIASQDNITEASFLMGIISLEKNSLNAAKKYFTLSAKDNHAQSYYNLALLESKNLKYINKKTVGLFKSAAMIGNLKAQHDYAIIMLKLFLNGKIGLKKSEIIHFYNVLDNIMTHTNNSILKQKAHHNLKHLMTLRSQFIIANNIHNKEINTPNETKIAFNHFETQGFENFEKYIEYENRLFSGS